MRPACVCAFSAPIATVTGSGPAGYGRLPRSWSTAVCFQAVSAAPAWQLGGTSRSIRPLHRCGGPGPTPTSDHPGYLPRLGAGPGRHDLGKRAHGGAVRRYLLPDSGRLLEDASETSRSGYSKHHPAAPLYDEAQARHCLRQFRSVGWEQPFTVAPDVQVSLRYQGRILGAAAVTVAHAGTRITFGGDIGRPRPEDAAPTATGRGRMAGGGIHPLQTAATRPPGRGTGGGVPPRPRPRRCGIIPAFAVRARVTVAAPGRRGCVNRAVIPPVPVYLNSPMAKATSPRCTSASARGAPARRAGLPPPARHHHRGRLARRSRVRSAAARAP